MALTEDVIKKIADDTDISINELTTSGVLAFLREKKTKDHAGQVGGVWQVQCYFIRGT